MATFISMATCHVCNNTVRCNGANRNMVPNFNKSHGSPVTASKFKTPQSANKSHMGSPRTPRDKTSFSPFSTPRSSSSSSSSTPMPAKTKQSPVCRLKNLLKLEHRQKTEKIGLKSFLSSL